MLRGEVRAVGECLESEIDAMYSLMDKFYDNTDKKVFIKDFYNKDYCILLHNEGQEIVGFTTQKILDLELEGKTVHGIFSGDTIIHSDYWGDTELFKVWADFWFDYAKKYEEFYWFLICKGYKTYRILPLFWKEFYPNYKTETPEYEKSIIDAYASYLYPKEYNPLSGVVEYKHTKDKLKSGVADIGEHEMKNRDIAYFCSKNPGYINGNDLACIAKIDKAALKKSVIGILFNGH